MAVGIVARSLAPLDSASRDAHGGEQPSALAVPFVYELTTVAATSTYSLVLRSSRRLRVIDAWCVATAAGGAGDQVIIEDGDGNNISSVMDLNVADTTLVRTTIIDDAHSDINEGEELQVLTASGAVARVYVKCVWL